MSKSTNTKPNERKELFNKLVFMFGWKGEKRRIKADKTLKMIDRYTEELLAKDRQQLIQRFKEELPKSNCERCWADDFSKVCTCDLISANKVVEILETMENNNG